MSPYLKDLLERLVATLIGASAATFGVDAATADALPLRDKLLIIAVAGAFSTVKGMVARRRGSTDDASLLSRG